MIDEKIITQLQHIFKNYIEIEKVLLFGSRARGDNKNTSDIDICIFGNEIDHLLLSKIYMDLDEVNTPLSFDILHFQELSKQELINNILNEGVEIYHV